MAIMELVDVADDSGAEDTEARDCDRLFGSKCEESHCKGHHNTTATDASHVRQRKHNSQDDDSEELDPQDREDALVLAVLSLGIALEVRVVRAIEGVSAWHQVFVDDPCPVDTAYHAVLVISTEYCGLVSLCEDYNCEDRG